MISKQLDEITAAVQAEFSGLDNTQLNRKPVADKWSIAQCLDHLVVSNDSYFRNRFYIYVVICLSI